MLILVKPLYFEESKCVIVLFNVSLNVFKSLIFLIIFKLESDNPLDTSIVFEIVDFKISALHHSSKLIIISSTELSY